MTADVDYDGPTEAVPAGKIMAGDMVWHPREYVWFKVADARRGRALMMLQGDGLLLVRQPDQSVLRAVETTPESE